MVFIFIKYNQIIANFNVFVNTLPLLWYNETYEFIYRYGKVLTQAKTNNLSPATQIPFEIKLAMPKPDRGGRGYSDKLVARLQNELSH